MSPNRDDDRRVFRRRAFDFLIFPSLIVALSSLPFFFPPDSHCSCLVAIFLPFFCSQESLLHIFSNFRTLSAPPLHLWSLYFNLLLPVFTLSSPSVLSLQRIALVSKAGADGSGFSREDVIGRHSSRRRRHLRSACTVATPRRESTPRALRR